MSSKPPVDEKDVFNAARKIADPDARERYLESVCGDDRQAFQRVQDLLSVHVTKETFLESPIIDVDATKLLPVAEQPGDQIGPYKLLEPLGEGGMGVVYLAEQSEPVQRRVAVKIIKPGMDTSRVIARFEAERQALAIMDHPNIARVFDAGATERGRPYFAMELVKGVPITQYCDEHRLDPRERLQLFQEVCHAVQHAHQKGIIHRDLKPSNVLVAQYDDQPVPKIIDFGVAKATQHRLTNKTMFTEAGMVVGTVEYMSPEQAKLNQLDIDTRSDIYSLGVLLYELLTGETPFDRKKLRSAALDEMLRIIREEEPSRPSIKLNTSESLPAIAANRRIEPRRLSMLVRGELDWIVMKALEKDRSRRYDSANAFADDIGNYLNDQAVEACPPSAGYRLRKFTRRNKALISVTSAVVLLLVALTIASTVAAGRFRKLARRNADLVESTKSALAKAVKAETDAEDAKREAEDARAVEQGLREKAQRQTQLATDALADAERERQRADTNRSLAEERELLARRNLYAAHMNLALDAWENADISRATDFLERHVPAPGEPDWRSFEWHYLAGLCNRDQLTIPCRHSSSRPEFSPDSTLVAVAIYRQQIELWDVQRSELIRTIKDDSVAGPVAFSPDGTTLASTGNGQLKLWNVSTGDLVRVMPGHAHMMLSVAFTPDGSRLISTDGGDLGSKNIAGIIRVWNPSTGEMIHEMKGHSTYIYNIAVSPDGRKLVSTGRDEIVCWDLLTGERLDLRIKGGHYGSSISWSPDGDSIATYRSGSVLIWDSSTGQQTASFPVLKGVLRYSPDGRSLVLGHDDGTVRVWEIESGTQSAIHRGHALGVDYATFSPNGKWIASVSRDGRVKVWAVDRKNQVSGVSGAAKRGVHEPGRDRIAISPDGKCFAGLSDEGTTVVMFDFSSGQERALLPVGSTVNAITFSPNGDQLVVAHSSGIQVWDCSTGELLRRHATESAALTVAVSPDGGSVAMGLDSRQIAIVEFDSLERQTVLPWQYLTPLRKVAFSPSGDSLAVVTAGPDKTLAKIHLWDTARWRVRFSIDVESRTLTDLCFSHDGTMLAVSEGNTFQPNDGAATRLIDANTGKQVAMLRSGAAYHSSVAFPAVGNAVATATNTGSVTLWDLETYDERMTLEVAGGQATGGNWDPIVESMLFAPDGRTLITSNARAEVWRWQTARQAQVDQLENAALLRRGSEYIRDRRWPKAVDLFSQMRRQGDNRQEVVWSRATALAELGRWDEATADFEELLASNSKYYRRWYELALSQLSSGDPAAYRDTCERMLDQFRVTKDPMVAEFACWTACLAPAADHDWGQILALNAELFYDGQAGSSAHRTLGAALVRAGLYEQAIDALRKAEDSVAQEQIRTSSEYNWYLLAIAHAKLGNFAKARACFDQTQPLDEAQPSVDSKQAPWFRRATLTALRRECVHLFAADKTLQAVSDAPTQAERMARGVRFCSRAIALKPEIPLLHELRANMFLQLNRIAESEADVARAAQLAKLFPLRRLNRLISNGGIDRNVLRIERARIYIDHFQNYDKALEDCHVGLRGPNRLDPRFLQLFFEIHEARGTLDVCHEQWPTSLGDRPPGEFFVSRAGFYLGQREHDKALADFERANEVAPTASVLNQIAGLHIAVDQWAKAIVCFDRLIKMRPSSVQLRTGRALCEFKQHGIAAYRARCRESYELFADRELSDSDKRALIAMVCMTSGVVEDTRRLNELASEMAAAKLDRPNFTRSTLAWALFRQGRTKEALELLSDRDDLEQVDKIHFLLAMLHHAAGDIDVAAEYLENSDAWLRQWSDEDKQSHWVAFVGSEINQQEAHERLGIPLVSSDRAIGVNREPNVEASKSE